MSIKTSLIFVALALVTSQARAAYVDCLLNYPDGNPVGNAELAVFYPNGSPLRTLEGELLYPNGEKLLTPDGTMTYADGKVLKAADGSVYYYAGQTLRTVDGQTFNDDGAKNPLVRYEIPYDDETTLILRAWNRGSRYKLRVKGQGTEMVVNIDDQQNIQCEFVKPIGPRK